MEFLALFETLAIAAAISVDAFAASFAYGGKRIKIPLLSVLIINLVCVLTLGISLVTGAALSAYIPEPLTALISFGILFVLGVTKFFDNSEPKNYDTDDSKIISITEAAMLAVALSMDGLAVGFGAALSNANIWAIILCTFAIGMLAVIFGCKLGNKVAGRLKVSWISGVLLIILAIVNLF